MKEGKRAAQESQRRVVVDRILGVIRVKLKSSKKTIWD